MPLLATLGLFLLTAIAEIVGCWLVLAWRKPDAPWWLLPAAAISLAVFAWLLTLHPAASGRVYAAYGGVYVAAALAWLWAVDGVRPGLFDVVGVGLVLAGTAVIISAHWLSTAG